MRWDSIKVEREEGLTLMTLNRPDKLNALNKEVLDEFKNLLELLETDRNLRAVIITGSGTKAFSVGHDLKEQQGMNEKDMLYRVTVTREIYGRLKNLPVPVVAAIEGMALGAGFELALACDLRVASRQASLGLPEVDMATIPSCGGIGQLLRLVGAGRTTELVLLGRRLSGEECFEWGLVHQVVAPGQCVFQARKWVTKIMEAGPIAIREAKQVISMGCDLTFGDGLKVEMQGFKQCLKSSDRLEGIRAFMEKRKPTYRGV